jgi:hypothetical protein
VAAAGRWAQRCGFDERGPTTPTPCPLTAARRWPRLGSKPAFIHLKVAGPLAYDFDRVFSTNV